MDTSIVKFFKQISLMNRLLLLFSGFIILLISARIAYSGSIRFIFICWNIFLAWVPYLLSGYFKVYEKKAEWKQFVLFFSWLIFFPNALYIITDLIHLEESTNIPVWYDVVILFAASFIGLVMAFLSLHRVEHYLREKFGSHITAIFILLIIFIGSFGVYLGRFLRWNSWDIFHNPIPLVGDILLRFTSPVDHYKTWAITTVLAFLNTFLYFFIKYLPKAFSEYKKSTEG